MTIEMKNKYSLKRMVIWSLVGKSAIDLSVSQHVPKKAL